MDEQDSRRKLTNISVELLDSYLEDLFDPIFEPPLPRRGYNRRGRIVARIIRLAIGHFPGVFWNEVAHARRAAVQGFPEIPVEKAPRL